MAFSIEAGQPIDEFMRSEQETIAEQYNTLYDTRLESVDTLKEIYVSLNTAGLFGLVIAGIHLVLFEVGGANDTPIEVASRLRFLLLASLVFVFIQLAAVFASVPQFQRTLRLRGTRWTRRFESISGVLCSFRVPFPVALSFLPR